MGFRAVEFFVNYQSPDHEPGYILMSPYTGCPEPTGYRREFAGDLPAVRRLEKILQRQEEVKNEAAWLKDINLAREGRQAVRDRLMAKMVSSSTTPYERDFIGAMLKLRDEAKFRKYEALYGQHQAYLTALHFDSHKNRREDEESVNLDRLNVSSD